jgi:hypothetical protein
MSTNALTKQKNSKTAANIVGLLKRQNAVIINQENSTPPFPEKIPLWIECQSLDTVQVDIIEINELHRMFSGLEWFKDSCLQNSQGYNIR